MQIKSYHLKLKWLYLVSIFTISLGFPLRAFAGVTDFLRLMAQFIWGYWIIPLTWLLQLELELLRFVASYNNFTSEGGVITGWIALRDLSNMFFIIILLVIAFATILRISSYGYQQLLKKTIIVAILINFSKTIVGFLIDIVQVVMLTFIAAVDNVMAGGVVVALGLQGIMTIAKNAVGADLAGPKLDDYIVALVMSSIFIQILVVVIGVMVMMLIMRIVALWVAIILAPLAFISSIFPATKSFYSKWTKEFGANLVSGPMLAFFLWLTLTIVGNGDAYKSFTDGEDIAGSGATEFLGTSNMVNYIVAIALLLTGIKQAAASGAAGANFASKGMSMIQDRASKMARRYPGAAFTRAKAGIARGLIRSEDGSAKSLTKGMGMLAQSKFGKSIKLDKLASGVTTGATRFDAKADELKSTDSRWKQYAGKTMGGVRDFKWNRMPGYGGAFQREAQKSMGEAPAKEAEFDSEDTKNVLDQHKSSFHESKKTLTGNRFQKWWSKATSLGGAGSQDAAYWQNELKEGRMDTSEKAQAGVQAAKGVHNQGLADDIHNHNPGVYDSEKEINRDIERKSYKGIMSGWSAESANGHNAELFLNTLRKHKDYKNGDVGRAVNNLESQSRIAWGEVLKESTENVIQDTDHKGDGSMLRRDEAGELIHGNNGELEMNNELMQGLMADIVNVYPGGADEIAQMIVAKINKELQEIKIPDGAITSLTKVKGETDDEFKGREDSWKESIRRHALDEDHEDYIDENTHNDNKRIASRYFTSDELEGQRAKIEAEREDMNNEEESDRLLSMVNGHSMMTIKTEAADLERAAQHQLDKAGNLEPRQPVLDTVAEPEEADIITRAKKLVAAEPESKSKIVGADGQKIKSEESTEDRIEGKKAQARDELMEEGRVEAADKHAEAEEKYEVDKEAYKADIDNLVKEMEEAIKGVNNNSTAKELDDLDKLQGTTTDPKKLEQLTKRTNYLLHLQNIRRRKILNSEVSHNDNHASRASLKDATDGSDYSRIFEADIGKDGIRHLVQELARVGDQNQQKQFLKTANPEQLQLFADAVVSSGQKLAKPVTDSLTANNKLRVYREIYVSTAMETGTSERKARMEAADKGLNELRHGA